MPKYAIIANIGITPGRMDEFLPLLLKHRERCLKDEPGTLQFDVLRPNNDDTKVMLYEVYRDESAFATHWDGPSRLRLDKEAAGMYEILSGISCTLLD